MTADRLPYPGLRAFDREEADLFFGRDGAVDQMIDRLVETRFLAVLGASGSGKSSLVKTGLLDGLELGLHPAGSSWKICTFTPGGNPFRNLAESLYSAQRQASSSSVSSDERESSIAILDGFLRQGPRSLIQWAEDGHLEAGSNLLLLVDQFEELFRYGGYAEREDAEAFVKLLMASTADAASNIHCVITLRSDFLGACALLPGLAETINSGAYLTPRMSRADVREAIVGPARMIGVDIEGRLVTRLLNDLVQFAPWDGDENSDQLRRIARRADQLPVMQHLLNRLWQHASARSSGSPVTITEEDYEALGGLNGALDAHGAELLSQFTADDQQLVQLIFRALVDGDSPSSAIRRPLRLADLVASTGASPASVRRVLDVFRADDCNFLRPGPSIDINGDTIVDISHESLIRQWSTLSTWVSEEARAANLWRRLATSAQRHEHSEGDLLSGLDLANLSSWWQAEQPTRHWSARYSGNYDDVETYLRLSVEEQEQRAKAQAEREQQNRKRLLIGLASVSVLAISASLLAFWAVAAERRATSANENAISVAQDLTTDLFERIDDGLSVPIATRFALIEDREKAIDKVAASLANDERTMAMRIDLLSRTSKTLLEAGWVRQAETRTKQLELMLSEVMPANDARLDESKQYEGFMAIAIAHYQLGAWEQAGSALNQAQNIATITTTNNNSRLRRLAEVTYYKFELAGKSQQLSEQLRQLDTLRALYHEARQLLAADTAQESQDDGHIVDKKNALVVIQYFIRAQLRAINYTYADLRSSARGTVDVAAVMTETDAAFELYEQFANVEDNAARALKSAYVREKGEYITDYLRDYDRAYGFADEAVSLAANLCATDTDNLYFRELLLFALLQRADIASLRKDNDSAYADVQGARAIAFDTKLSHPLLPGWAFLDQNVSYFLYLIQTRNNQPANARAGAVRLKVEIDHAVRQFESSSAMFERNFHFVLFSLLDPDLSLDVPIDEVRKYAKNIVETTQSERDSSDDRLAQRRLRGWSYNRLLQLSPEEIGDNAWEEYFGATISNGNLEDPAALGEIPSLEIFQYLPLKFARHISPDSALAARHALLALSKLDITSDIEAALQIVSEFLETVPVPDHSEEAQIGHIKLRHAVVSKFVPFQFDTETRDQWLAVIQLAITETTQIDIKDDQNTLNRTFFLGWKASSFSESNEAARRRDEYKGALQVALDGFSAASSQGQTLRNAIVFARTLLELSDRQPMDSGALQQIDRLFGDFLANESYANKLHQSHPHIRSLDRVIGEQKKRSAHPMADRWHRYDQAIAAALAFKPVTEGSSDSDAFDTEWSRGPIETDFYNVLNSASVKDVERVSWGFSPIFSGAWRTVLGAQRDRILERLFDDEEATNFYVRVLPLPFYDDGQLVEVERQREDGAIGLHTALLFPDRSYVLDGTSPPIHTANANAPIRIRTADDAAAYIRFFGSYVNGEAGAFQIVDSTDEINWSLAADVDVIEETQRILRPLAVWKDDESGHFRASATVHFGNSVFSSIFKIAPTGMVEMVADRAVASDLPILPISVEDRRAGRLSREQLRNVDFSAIGVNAPGLFTSELSKIVSSVKEHGAEKMKPVIAEYASYLSDGVFLSSLGRPENIINTFAYNLLEANVSGPEISSMTTEAVRLAPDTPHILDTHGWALAREGRYQESILALEMAEQLFLKEPPSEAILQELYAHLGYAYRYVDELEKARQALLKAQSYDVPGPWMDFAIGELALLGEIDSE